MMTRRQALKTAALAAAGATILPAAKARSAATPTAAGPFQLPPLPYPFDALEPHIDARTMEIHHDKHHAAYVANLNKAVAEFPELAKKPIEDLLRDFDAIPVKVRPAIHNHGGGHLNHSLFWQMMKPGGGGEPKGDLASALEKKFGSFAAFKDQFADTAVKLFGSGWAWLVVQSRPGSKTLAIMTSANQDSPIALGLRKPIEPLKAPEPIAKKYGIREEGTTLDLVPVLGLDVWEHAYYLKYQNRRADYIAAWFNVINWDFVAERYRKLTT